MHAVLVLAWLPLVGHLPLVHCWIELGPHWSSPFPTSYNSHPQNPCSKLKWLLIFWNAPLSSVGRLKLPEQTLCHVDGVESRYFHNQPSFAVDKYGGKKGLNDMVPCTCGSPNTCNVGLGYHLLATSPILVHFYSGLVPSMHTLFNWSDLIFWKASLSKFENELHEQSPSLEYL